MLPPSIFAYLDPKHATPVRSIWLMGVLSFIGALLISFQAVVELVNFGAFAGFVITFASGSAYGGENFAWFAERHPDFCYLDRIVLLEQFHRRGLGTFVYDQLEGACGRPVFALEVNLDQPKEPSLAFHRARGYVEVGQRISGGHLVSLMTKDLRLSG